MGSLPAGRGSKRAGARMVALLAAALAVAGCGLGDSDLVACRCTPDTNALLFPQCPDFEEVIQTPNGELWVTAAGDTLEADADWIVVEGGRVSRGSAGSSSIFGTGTPDCPVGQTLLLHERTRPDLVIFNLRTVLLARPEVRSADLYMDQLSGDFIFVPDPIDVEEYPGVYDASRDTLWNREQERRFAQNVLDPARVGTVSLTRWYLSSSDERSTSEDGLTETFFFPYEGDLELKGVDGEESTTLGFRGRMELDLVTPTLENPVWSVARWRDEADLASTKLSWGELRAQFAR